MNVSQLLRWQWQGYPVNHTTRANLLLHIAVVPLFLLGNIVLVVSLLQGAWMAAMAGAVIMIVSIALQGRGHLVEPVAPVPFTGPVNAVARIFLEQWVTFPRFVLSGGWLRAWRGAEQRTS